MDYLQQWRESLLGTYTHTSTKNMPAKEAMVHWLSGGLRFPWIEAWNYVYLVTGVAVYLFSTPSFEVTANLELGWACRVLLRNLAMYWATFGGTHYLLYTSTVKEELVREGKKFNPVFPGQYPWLHA